MTHSAARLDRSLLAAMLGVAVMLPAQHAVAQQSEWPSDDWHFKVTPYLWATAIDGDVGIGRLPAVEIDADFSDVLDELDFAFMGTAEARKGRWGVLFDGVYAKFSADADTPGPLFGKGTVDFVQQLYSLAGAYRLVEGHAPIDVLGGLRYVYVKPDVGLTAGLLPARSASRTKDWIDGFAGLRIQYSITDRWSLLGYADIGGGGSDLTWQALGGVTYRISKTFEAQLGYRYLSIDYDEGSGSDRFLYDINMSGPYLSLGIYF